MNLKDRLEYLKREQKDLDEEVRSLQKKLSKKSKEIEQVKAAIEEEELRNRPISVTDHALIRYMERVLGIDVEKIRNDMITEETKRVIYSVGSGKIPIGDGHRLWVKDRTITTVV